MISLRNIKYINQIKEKKENTLVKQAYIYETGHSHIRITIETTANNFNNNLNTLLDKEIDIYKLSKYKLKQYIKTVFSEKWKNTLSISSKADTYKTFKNTPKFEKYFDCIINTKHLRAFTKLRLSDHNLMIEEGRRKRPIIPRKERICDTCKKYKHLRIEAFKTINEEVPNFSEIADSRSKFLFLMSQENEKLIKLIAFCTYEWFIIREIQNV